MSSESCKPLPLFKSRISELTSNCKAMWRSQGKLLCGVQSCLPHAGPLLKHPPWPPYTQQGSSLSTTINKQGVLCKLLSLTGVSSYINTKGRKRPISSCCFQILKNVRRSPYNLRIPSLKRCASHKNVRPIERMCQQ